MKYAVETYGKNILMLNHKDIIYALSSISYGFSFTTTTFQAFNAGATVLISSSHNIFDIIDTIKTFRPTVLCGVPSIFAMLLNVHTQVENIDLKSVKFGLSSGENLNPVTMNKWYKEFKIPLIEGYGSVEMLTNVISNTRNSQKVGSVGKIVKGFKYKFDKNGVLIVNGKCISTLRIEKENLSSNSKLYYTKDIFQKDRDGYFWYKGRKDEKFKYNGIWLNPIDIENKILSISKISDCYVMKHNEQLYLFYKSANNLSKDELKSIYLRLRKSFIHSVCPNFFIRVKNFSYNNNGKRKRMYLNRNNWINVERIISQI